MNKENFEKKYTHIKGWGIDADPTDRPNYPIKNETGDDHKRLGWHQPEQQDSDVEILQSNERPSRSAVFGTSVPPSGLSGIIRRMAFKHSEGKLRHWLPLLVADRVNVVEGLVEDAIEGYFPNLLEKTGLKEEWRKHPEKVALKAAAGLSIAGAIVLYLAYSKRKSKRGHALEVFPLEHDESTVVEQLEPVK